MTQMRMLADFSTKNVVMWYWEKVRAGHSSTSTGVRERGLTGLDAVTRSGGDRLEQVAAALVSLLPNTHGSPGRLGESLR